MARQARMIENNGPIDAEHEDVTRQVEADDADESAIAAELGLSEGDTQYTFTAHKHIPGSKFTEWCMEGTMADMPITPKLQANWGAGKYRITIQKNGKFFNRHVIAVAAAPQFRNRQAEPTNVNGNDPQIMALLTRLVERTEQQQTQPPRMQMTPENIVLMIGAIAPAVTALKTLFAAPPMDFTQLKSVMEIAAEFRGDGGREPSFMETIVGALTNKDLLSTLTSALPNQQPQAPQLPAPQQPQQRKQPTPEQMQQAAMAQIRAQIEYLISKAVKGSDPDLYADWIIDNFPEQLVQQLATAGAMEFILTLHPGVAPHRTWFEAVLASLAEALQNGGAEGETAPAPAPTPGAPGGSPVPQQSSPVTVIYDPLGQSGDANDAETYGEGGEGW